MFFAGQFECTHPHNDKYHCKESHDFSKAFHVFAVEWCGNERRFFGNGDFCVKNNLICQDRLGTNVSTSSGKEYVL